MIPAAIAPKIGRLISLLASDNDGEALSACRALGRTLQAGGVDFHALAAAVQRQSRRSRRSAEPCASGDLEMWAALVRNAQADADTLPPRDRVFLKDMAALLGRGRLPSAKQAAWLRDIDEKVSVEPSL